MRVHSAVPTPLAGGALTVVEPQAVPTALWMRHGQTIALGACRGRFWWHAGIITKRAEAHMVVQNVHKEAVGTVAAAASQGG